MRLSPSIDLKIKFQKKTSKINYFDPFVPSIDTNTGLYKNMKSVNLNTKILKESDVVMILTDHDNINYKTILKFSKLIVDTRGVYKSLKLEKILKV